LVIRVPTFAGSRGSGELVQVEELLHILDQHLVRNSRLLEARELLWRNSNVEGADARPKAAPNVFGQANDLIKLRLVGDGDPLHPVARVIRGRRRGRPNNQHNHRDGERSPTVKMHGDSLPVPRCLTRSWPLSQPLESTPDAKCRAPSARFWDRIFVA